MHRDAGTLERFMHRFVGYGTPEASTWFFGPEEAGADSAEELWRRIDAWVALGGGEFVDLVKYHEELGVTQWFGEKPPLQPTWRSLVEIALLLTGQELDKKATQHYQANLLGRTCGDTLSGELMPLSKPSLAAWPYASLGELVPFMTNRDTYLEAVRPARIELLRSLIDAHKPPRVVFYGTTGKLKEAWQEVSGGCLNEMEGGYAVGRRAGTNFVLMKHPTAYGQTKAYYHRVASLLQNDERNRL